MSCSSLCCSRYKGRWDPIKTSLKDKRHLPANGNESQTKKVKQTPTKISSSREAGQFVNECKTLEGPKKDSSWNTEVLDKENGEIEPSEFEAIAMKLVQLLPMRNDDKAEKTAEVKNLLVKLFKVYEFSITCSIRKILQVPIHNLSRQNHSALSQIATALFEKLKASYNAAFVLRFKKALLKNDAIKVQQKVNALHKKITDGDLDEAFIRNHNMFDLLANISLYFKDRGLAEPKELFDINAKLNEDKDRGLAEPKKLIDFHAELNEDELHI